MNSVGTNEEVIQPVVVVCLPVRNEEESILEVLSALKTQNLVPSAVFLTDDGSTDRTLEIAAEFSLVTIKHRKNRGYDVVGTVEMARVFNDCIMPSTEYNKEKQIDYLLILAGDIVLPQNYIKDLVKKFETNQNLMIASGSMTGNFAYKSTGYMVPGPGRMMKYSYWDRLGAQYPLKQGWEAYPVHMANMEGYVTAVFNDIEYYPLRPTGGRTDFQAYGEAMKALGYYAPFAIGRSFKQIFMKKRGLKAAINMLRGFFFGKPDLYEEKLRKHIKKGQKKRLRKLFFRF